MASIATLVRSWLQVSPRERGGLSSRQRLFVDQIRITGGRARTIFDVGAQHGQNALQYYHDFPEARIFAFEPVPENLARTRREVGAKADRIEVLGSAVAEAAGTLELNLNSHDGTHSRLPIGDTRYWAGPAEPVGRISVPATTIDAFMSERGLDDIDILAMDIQGGEMSALRGAERALRSGSIGLISIEVSFKPLYRDLPLFWEIGDFLAKKGFNLFGLYDCVYVPANEKILSWADAIFVGPRHQKLDRP
ncbi:MAG: FkbM family methyltransferase [Reyranellales bacterium]